MLLRRGVKSCDSNEALFLGFLPLAASIHTTFVIQRHSLRFDHVHSKNYQCKEKGAVFLFCSLLVMLLHLKTTTATSRLASCRIGWNRCDIFNSSNLHAISCQRPECGLCTRSRTASLGSSRPTDLDVQGGDSEFLALFGDILGGKHSSIWGRFITIGLDFHSSSDTDQCFSSRQVCHVHKSIIEGGKQVGNTKDFLAFLDADSANSLCLFFAVSLQIEYCCVICGGRGQRRGEKLLVVWSSVEESLLITLPRELSPSTL